jgi:hypothetical protein
VLRVKFIVKKYRFTGITVIARISPSLNFQQLQNSEASWKIPKFSEVGVTCFLSYGRFPSDSSTSRLKSRHFFANVSLINTMIVRDIAEMALRDEAEDMCFVVKFCRTL